MRAAFRNFFSRNYMFHSKVTITQTKLNAPRGNVSQCCAVVVARLRRQSHNARARHMNEKTFMLRDVSANHIHLANNRNVADDGWRAHSRRRLLCVYAKICPSSCSAIVFLVVVFAACLVDVWRAPSQQGCCSQQSFALRANEI